MKTLFAVTVEVSWGWLSCRLWSVFDSEDFKRRYTEPLPPTSCPTSLTKRCRRDQLPRCEKWWFGARLLIVSGGDGGGSGISVAASCVLVFSYSAQWRGCVQGRGWVTAAYIDLPPPSPPPLPTSLQQQLQQQTFYSHTADSRLADFLERPVTNQKP